MSGFDPLTSQEELNVDLYDRTLQLIVSSRECLNELHECSPDQADDIIAILLSDTSPARQQKITETANMWRRFQEEKSSKNRGRQKGGKQWKEQQEQR